MSRSDERPEAAPGGAGQFHTTHWSVVLTAGQQETPQAREALEELCRTYWPPLYAYVRRQGTPPDLAQDVVQGLFTSLIEQRAFARVNRDHGKFRSFLLGALKHFLANEQDHARALKRGGNLIFVPWDEGKAEKTFRSARMDALSPELAFEKSWALALLNRVLARLREEYVRMGKAPLFDALQIYLTGDKGDVPYAEAARRLKLKESALKMSIQRLRRRYGDLLRAEIARTVSTAQEIDEEIRALFAAVRR